MHAAKCFTKYLTRAVKSHPMWRIHAEELLREYRIHAKKSNQKFRVNADKSHQKYLKRTLIRSTVYILGSFIQVTVCVLLNLIGSTVYILRNLIRITVYVVQQDVVMTGSGPRVRLFPNYWRPKSIQESNYWFLAPSVAEEATGSKQFLIDRRTWIWFQVLDGFYAYMILDIVNFCDVPDILTLLLLTWIFCVSRTRTAR